MKFFKFSFLLLFTLITFTSCFEVEEDIPSCIDVDIAFEDDNYKLKAKIYTSNYIEIEMINECDLDIRVTGIKVEGQHYEDFHISGLSIGTSITKNTYFDVIFTPTQLGARKGIIVIRHEVGELVINLPGEGT
ncbi:hypothetical protein MK851_05235 [Tenacibaculum sp. 1B UA]|uniref:hypothetical protein n=1 Tax=unclassified Tenacibaculum TaxID=2635139 RepID=UPI0026E2CB33|nr:MULTISPECIES: hypothetical protein [unclassified Tenacibaculum]MDO6675595.1 hypothetical protein [Tenacibaculum sp. 1_MG-2023]MDX8553028.1 hypothetical protein [Tenacibaculum sp. 1B UA]